MDRAFAALGQRPGVLKAYNELYALSQVRPHRTVAFHGFEPGELRAIDAAMLTSGNQARPAWQPEGPWIAPMKPAIPRAKVAIRELALEAALQGHPSPGLHAQLPLHLGGAAMSRGEERVSERPPRPGPGCSAAA